MPRLCVFLLAFLPALVACVDDSQGPVPEPPPVPEFDLQATLTIAVDEAVLPAVEEFHASTAGLQSAAESFCSAPDAVTLEQLQDRWRDAFEQWYRLSLYNFGPLNDNFVFPAFTFIDSLRLRGTNYLETVRSEIADDISSSTTLDADYFAGKTFQRVGLLALESVIFETSTGENSAAPADIVAEFQFAPRKCEVLAGLAGQLRFQASYVENGWLVDHLGSGEPYRSLFLSDQLDDGTEPFSQILISGQEFLDYLQARNVVTTAAPISGHAWEAIDASIDEVEVLLRGQRGSSGSVFDYMESVGQLNEIAAVEDSISQVRQAIADRDPEMLEVTLGFLDGNFKREIPDSLAIDLGINFSDGD